MMRKLILFALLCLPCLVVAQAADLAKLNDVYGTWRGQENQIQYQLEETKHHVWDSEHNGFRDMTPAEFSLAKARADGEQSELSAHMRTVASPLLIKLKIGLSDSYSLQDLKNALKVAKFHE